MADRLGGEEGLEDAVEIFGSDAAAGIGDAEADEPIAARDIGFAGRDARDVDADRARLLADRLRRVGHEIHHHLLDLTAIGMDRRHGVELLDDRDRLRETRAQNPEHIRDIAPHVKTLEGFLFPATYELPRHPVPSELTAEMVRKFKEEWARIAATSPIAPSPTTRSSCPFLTAT